MQTTTATPDIQHITLGGGCFWCIEAVFEQVDGVLGCVSGYAMGHVDSPTYEQVCTGRTGHVEVVRVTFDAARIPLRAVLEIFFTVHDPTTRDRQGNDVGPQYRSGIYWDDPRHEAVAREVLHEVDAALGGGRVVTELLPLRAWHAAEDDHQHYFAQHPNQGYCAYVVAPKVEKFRRTFAERVRRG